MMTASQTLNPVQNQQWIKLGLTLENGSSNFQCLTIVQQNQKLFPLQSWLMGTKTTLSTPTMMDPSPFEPQFSPNMGQFTVLGLQELN